MHIRHLLYYSSCQLFTNFQFFCVDWKLKQIAWVGAAYDATSTSEHLFPAVSEEGGDCGVAMVTRILPDPPAAKDLLFFWTHWLWRHLARDSLGVYDLNLIFVPHVFSDYPFLGFHEPEWQLQHWIPDKAPSGAGYACLPLEFIEEMSCSTHCQEITFLKNAGFFPWDLGDCTSSLMCRVDGCMPPSAATAALGDGCPLTSCWLLAGSELLYASLGQAAYRGPSHSWELPHFTATQLLTGLCKPSYPLQCAINLTRGLGDQDEHLSS